MYLNALVNNSLRIANIKYDCFYNAITKVKYILVKNTFFSANQHSMDVDLTKINFLKEKAI
jgi:hypothetical protein